ncbi:hypothetical protein M8J77_010426 [Diaphorina citri]|nr:hypothetical protein M8J77_010426 [Diaphorina citri]
MIETNSYTVDDSSRDEVLTTVTRRFPIVRFLIEPKFLTGLGSPQLYCVVCKTKCQPKAITLGLIERLKKNANPV